MVRIYYTKCITSGLLKGIYINESIAYPTIEGCAEFVKRCRMQKKGRNWIIVDASFQSYAR